MLTEYCVAYPDPHPYMDGPRKIRTAVSTKKSHAEQALKLLSRHHPEAQIESRAVTEWSADVDHAEWVQKINDRLDALGELPPGV